MEIGKERWKSGRRGGDREGGIKLGKEQWS